ncbi:hypothetical protein AT3G56260 [Arabidopsis thaliana]|jgi:hypothetical protein|uniref:At3g56260 n=2 Tax=Arabidopsis thaliana TaxID=3702 RepID=Q6NLT4_ARATH|nr:uncharacterized protein AT3G56260 [Arabidopsis thaliana]AAS47606.1 At3g56260 [Arabidopsis thaliana]AAS76733.1 At3g56260 [Arabidopsis thaliana]AEE79503.1 hypothetical protein AT3G56260 [Arabidopsis thaliana]CAA0386750.1 unnamed protein product [Arabidopsis thaliana]|eukprot:NP_001190104.1 hypothetical protein AT3G56260 [Arabidopsis thaliana]
MSERLEDDFAIDEERSSYYGGASIPFIWESRPGTPKNHLCSDSSLPLPLTPPPSYYSSGILSTPRTQSKVRSKLSKFLSFSMFSDLRRSNHGSKKTASSSFSWSSTSSSSSFSSSPPHSLKKRMSHDKKSPLLYANYEEDELRSSPTSTLCCSNGGRLGCSSSMGSVTRALFSGSMEGMKRHETTGKALIISDMNKA